MVSVLAVPTFPEPGRRGLGMIGKSPQTQNTANTNARAQFDPVPVANLIWLAVDRELGDAVV